MRSILHALHCSYLAATLAGSGTTNIQLCGRLAVELRSRRIEGELPGGQGRRLFGFLLANRARPVRRDELVEAIWPESLPATPELSLSALLSRLRKVMGAGVLEGRSELQLVLPPDAWVDVEAAAAAIHRAESALATGDWARAYAPAVIARRIASREFLTGENAPWIDDQRRSIEDLLLRALECDATASLGIGGAEVPIAVRTARELVERAPARESGYRILMEALEVAGDPAEALRSYERLRRMLRDELGTSPSAATQSVHDRLLKTTPAGGTDLGEKAGPAASNAC